MIRISERSLFLILTYPQITEQMLLARCARWVTPLNEAMAKFAITTPARAAHFLGQLAHESGRFAFVRELWGPTAAQRGYEGRRDLGNTEPGDGFRYRGRGLIQVTGRANYRDVGKALGVDLITHPELLERPETAALASAWWWQANGLNELADIGNIDHVSDRINRGRVTRQVGDSNGYLERKLLTERALRVLGVMEDDQTPDQA